MLATLYAKALDADFENPILGDRYAKQIVERIDYDWQKTTISARRASSVVVEHFDSGELQFDVFNWLGIKSQVLKTVVRRSGSTLRWAINGPDDIVAAVPPGVRLLAWERWFESETFARLPRSAKMMGKAMALVSAVANMSQYHRYAFGTA
jgi:hypothetical protein